MRQLSTYHQVGSGQVRSGHFINEENVLFNDALNTFMVKRHHARGLLFSISSNGSYIRTIPQTR